MVYKLVVFIGILFLPYFSYALHIHGIYLDVRFESSNDSPYKKILGQLEEDSKVSLDVGVFPVKRAADFFLKEKDSCILPSTIAIIKLHYPEKTKSFDMIESDPIEHVTSRIYSRKGEPLVKDFKELEGKTLISWIGIPAKKMIPGVNFKEIKTTSDVQAISVLNSKRGDYLMGWTPDTPLVAKKNNLVIPEYFGGLYAMDTQVKIVCHRTEETEKFIKRANIAIKEMKKNGELKEILGKHSEIAK